MWNGVKGGLVAAGSALGASVCCVLPLALVLLGVSSGALMVTTMQYRWLLLPLGLTGLGAGYALYVRDRRRCATAGCRMAGRRTAVALLVVATLLAVAELAVTLYPEPVARLLAGVPDPAGTGSHVKSSAPATGGER